MKPAAQMIARAVDTVRQSAPPCRDQGPSPMSTDINKNRLRLEMDRALRDLNREIINPQLPEMHLDDLKPAMAMVARARARYLKRLLDIAASDQELPDAKQIASLHAARVTYEELVTAIRALETAIERGYLDVKR